MYELFVFGVFWKMVSENMIFMFDLDLNKYNLVIVGYRFRLWFVLILERIFFKID